MGMAASESDDELSSSASEDEEEGAAGSSSDESSDPSEDEEMAEDDVYRQAFRNMQDAVFQQADALASRGLEKATTKREEKIRLVNDTHKELQKAKHTRNQQKLWDAVLKLRIKEQRSLTMANRLPQGEMLQAFQAHDHTIHDLTTRISSSLQDLLGSLLQTGYELRAQHTKMAESAVPDAVQTLFEANDEPTKLSRKRKRAFFSCPEEEDAVEFYWRLLDEYHTSAEPFHEETLDYWQKKTQLANRISQAKFKAINQSIPAQVDLAMQAPEKLIERTQQLRSTTARILGKTDEDNTRNENNVLQDPEIFDDAQFYQQMLKSLLEQEGEDQAETARTWLQNRNQNKKRKAYDSRLSKDRVLKFHVHEKLVDFTTPTEQQPPAYADDLFKNLFQ